MHRIGRHPGPGLFSPAASIRSTADALKFAFTYGAQTLQMGSENFNSIIEYLDGWYLTDRGVVSREHPYYLIGRERVDEMDWEQHISDKGWDGIYPAMRVARKVFDQSDRTRARRHLH